MHVSNDFIRGWNFDSKISFLKCCRWAGWNYNLGIRCRSLRLKGWSTVLRLVMNIIIGNLSDASPAYERNACHFFHSPLFHPRQTSNRWKFSSALLDFRLRSVSTMHFFLSTLWKTTSNSTQDNKKIIIKWINSYDKLNTLIWTSSNTGRHFRWRKWLSEFPVSPKDNFRKTNIKFASPLTKRRQ
jgi:hypothetical protein